MMTQHKLALTGMAAVMLSATTLGQTTFEMPQSQYGPQVNAPRAPQIQHWIQAGPERGGATTFVDQWGNTRIETRHNYCCEPVPENKWQRELKRDLDVLD